MTCHHNLLQHRACNCTPQHTPIILQRRPAWGSGAASPNMMGAHPYHACLVRTHCAGIRTTNNTSFQVWRCSHYCSAHRLAPRHHRPHRHCLQCPTPSTARQSWQGLTPAFLKTQNHGISLSNTGTSRVLAAHLNHGRRGIQLGMHHLPCSAPNTPSKATGPARAVPTIPAQHRSLVLPTKRTATMQHACNTVAFILSCNITTQWLCYTDMPPSLKTQCNCLCRHLFMFKMCCCDAAA